MHVADYAGKARPYRVTKLCEPVQNLGPPLFTYDYMAKLFAKERRGIGAHIRSDRIEPARLSANMDRLAWRFAVLYNNDCVGRVGFGLLSGSCQARAEGAKCPLSKASRLIFERPQWRLRDAVE